MLLKLLSRVANNVELVQFGRRMTKHDLFDYKKEAVADKGIKSWSQPGVLKIKRQSFWYC